MGLVVTTALEKPMLDVLIRHIQRMAQQPAGVAGMLVLLPNRRSCIAMKKRFAELSAGRAMLLPAIHPIGEVDEDALGMDALFHDPALAMQLAQLKPAVGATQRLMAVAQEIYRRRESFGLAVADMEQATRLAADVCAFLDELERDGVAFDAVAGLWPERFAEHWQQSLSLLKHIVVWWPQQLAKCGMESVIGRRNQLLALLAAHWRTHPPQTAVIAAGSTGTQPATASLLKVIAGLPHGMVVLPGLDLHAEPAIWAALEPCHPQYGLAQLLRILEVQPDAVTLLDDAAVAGGSYGRARLLLESCRPCSLTHQWQRPDAGAQALEGLVRIDCQHEWEEAQAVCLLLREALETPDKRAALITHDADLARRVRALMTRYGVTLDSASGNPLLTHPAWQLFYGLSLAASQPYNPLPLLSVVKHPLCDWMRPALLTKLEHSVFRGQRRNRDVLARMQWFARSDALTPDEAETLMRVCDVLQPIYRLSAGGAVAVVDMLAAQRRCFEQLAGEADADMALILHQLEAALAGCEAMPPVHYHRLLMQCLSLHKWFERQEKGHPRLHIYTPMEARLQPLERVILGGMNEGVWPHGSAVDAWMNEAIRQSIGLPPRMAHQGLEAHDWLMLASGAEVFVTRAMRCAGVETLPSRWLERLDSYVGVPLEARQRYAQSPYLDWLRAHNQVAEVAAIEPPCPLPPVEALPQSLSVTQMEQWMRNPYAAYARHVLHLQPLQALDEELSAADMGDVLHRLFERFVLAVNADASQLTMAVLQSIADDVLREYADQPQVMMMWQPRIQQLLPWILQQERERRAISRRILPEQPLDAVFTVQGAQLQLHARIDRLEEAESKQWRVIDYKTKHIPEAKDIQHGYACQLPLSALILAQSNGGISEMLEYWSMGGGYREVLVKPVVKAEEQERLLDFYRDGLLKTIAQYYVERRAFYAVPVPQMRSRFDDYAHLARVEEWLN